MALKITASDLLTSRWLEVDSDGVVFYEGSMTGSKKRFRFAQVDSVLMSADNQLSFQAANEIYTIPVKPGNAKHDQVIAALVQEVKRSNGMM